MLDLWTISRLYRDVLDYDVESHQIPEDNIRKGILVMNHAYAPTTLMLSGTTKYLPNFNDVSFRCAYLHKYAALHTYVVFEVMIDILLLKRKLFEKILKSGAFRLCSLGGGPGCDVIGVVEALQTKFGVFDSSVTVVDVMESWRETFTSIISELKGGDYDDWYCVLQRMQWRFCCADLLTSMTDEVNKAIGTASFVTMVKFISAAAIKEDTECMIEKIFRVMKPGALILFVDNAAGGFTELVEKAAEKYSFKFVFGPRRHLKFSEDVLKEERFGYVNCFETSVSVMLLQKPYCSIKNKNQRSQSYNLIEYTPSYNFDFEKRKCNKSTQTVDPFQFRPRQDSDPRVCDNLPQNNYQGTANARIEHLYSRSTLMNSKSKDGTGKTKLSKSGSPSYIWHISKFVDELWSFFSCPWKNLKDIPTWAPPS